MHFAEDDEFIGKGAQARIKQAPSGAPSATVSLYARQKHAFARHTFLHYHKDAPALPKAWTYASLADHLGLRQPA